MEKDIKKGLHGLYNFDYDHLLDHRDGLDVEDQEDDLSWPDDLFAIYGKEVTA
jgi:hypothetical protein